MLKSSDAFDNSEANWESSGAGTAVPEDSDLLLQLLNNGTFTSEMSHGLPMEMPSMYWPETDVVSSYFSSNDGNSSLYCWGHGGGGGDSGSGSGYGSSQLVLSHLDLENYYLNVPSTNDGPTSKKLCLEDETYEPKEVPIDDRRCIVEDDEGRKLLRTAKRKPTKLEANENLKKKASKIKDVENDEDNSQTKQTHKKNKKGDESREQNNSANKQISSENFSSEEESCESQETNVNGGNDDDNSSTKGSSKRKAQRGTATDPQSLYARKRRQRINERLRILQNLVPNGTKVDISTMLEEAVQYVKFLQLQIKLLSSDDLWMYAPLAYNGMTIGLDLKISLPQ